MKQQIELLLPGTTAPKAGQYVIVDPLGRSTGNEVVVSSGEPLPETPESGQHYVLLDALRFAGEEKTA